MSNTEPSNLVNMTRPQPPIASGITTDTAARKLSNMYLYLLQPLDSIDGVMDGWIDPARALAYLESDPSDPRVQQFAYILPQITAALRSVREEFKVPISAVQSAAEFVARSSDFNGDGVLSGGEKEISNNLVLQGFNRILAARESRER